MWILLTILAVLLFLLSMPVTITAAYEDEITLKLQYLFFKIGILPAPPKEEKEEKPPKEKKKKASKEEQQPKKKKKRQKNPLQQLKNPQQKSVPQARLRRLSILEKL